METLKKEKNNQVSSLLLSFELFPYPTVFKHLSVDVLLYEGNAFTDFKSLEQSWNRKQATQMKISCKVEAALIII